MKGRSGDYSVWLWRWSLSLRSAIGAHTTVVVGVRLLVDNAFFSFDPQFSSQGIHSYNNFPHFQFIFIFDMAPVAAPAKPLRFVDAIAKQPRGKVIVGAIAGACVVSGFFWSIAMASGTLT